MGTIKEFIKPYTDQILMMKRRFHIQDAFLKKAKTAFGEKRFNIRNEFIWQLLIDSNDMLVIDFSSFCKSMYEPGGFFACLKNHVKALRIPSPSKISINPPTLVNAHEFPESRVQEIKISSMNLQRDRLHENRLAAFNRLFPECEAKAGNYPKAQDIDSLKDSFVTQIQDIIEDRDDNRAHRFQKAKQSLNTPLVTLEKLEARFEYVERIFNDLTLVSDLSQLMFKSISIADPEPTAIDLLDLITMGSINTIINETGIPNELENRPRKYYHQFRRDLKYEDIEYIWPKVPEESDDNN